MGTGFVTTLPNGNLGLRHPGHPDGAAVDMTQILSNLTNRGISAPILLRVSNFSQHRIEQINLAFQNAIEQLGYQGHYQGVFPVKVNQQAQVIERIVDFGRPFEFGLEVGSKAELLIALSQDLPDAAAVVCNGVKDDEFLRLALMSQRLGSQHIHCPGKPA